MSESEEEKKRSYFNMSAAVDELRLESFGKREKAVAGLKILGKGLFNAVKYTAKEVLPAVTNAAATSTARQADKQLKDPDLSDAQRAKLEGIRSKASDKSKI